MVELYRLEGSLSGLSMLGSGAVMLTYWLMKDLRKHPTSLVFWLSFCDFFFSLKFFATAVWFDSNSVQEHAVACLAQSIAAQFFGLASISWNAMISLNLLVQLRNPFANTAGFAKFYHIWVWLLAASTTAVMVIAQAYGVSGDGTCWISNTKYRLMFFTPLLAYFLISLTTLLVAVVRMRNIQAVMSTDASTKVVFRMALYVLTFIVFWSGPLLHRTVQYFAPDSTTAQSTALQYMDAIGASAQGFVNGLVWLTSPSFYIPFKQVVLRTLKFVGREGEKLPLLPEQLDSHFQDSSQDIQRLDILLRKYMISCILLGTRKAISDIVDNKEDKFESDEKDFEEVRTVDNVPWEEASNLQEEHKYNPRFKFIDYAPLVFMKLRELEGITPSDYLVSMEPNKFLVNLGNQKFSEGRSGSFFVFSPDKRFILKTIPESEALLLLKILPDFHRHLVSNPESLIIRFFGLHAISMQAGGMIYVSVMENVFNTPLKIHEKYDLKGSWVRREVGKKHEENPYILGMDLDLQRVNRKLRISREQKEKFLDQSQKDSQFFQRLSIMDYSLLVGFHFVDRDKEDFEIDAEVKVEERVEEESSHRFNRKYRGGMLSSDGKEVYFTGIIDILQLYDAQKQREHFFKVYLLRKDKLGISAQPPEIYSERFISAMQNIAL